jgi:hypothetical protein
MPGTQAQVAADFKSFSGGAGPLSGGWCLSVASSVAVGPATEEKLIEIARHEPFRGMPPLGPAGPRHKHTLTMFVESIRGGFPAGPLVDPPHIE